MSMKKYLSFGGGVNSTALLILLRQQNINFEAVFVDHGGDYPETYEYVQMLIEHGYPITVLKTTEPLYDYAMRYRIIPGIGFRWCTDKFKVRVLYKYFQRPCICFLGFDAGETRRAERKTNIEGIENEFPLIEAGIDRQGCVDLIKSVGLSVPKKSGCFFCPFQSKRAWIEIRDNRQNLYCKAVAMENACVQRLRERGIRPFYLAGKWPLSDVVLEGQEDLFFQRQPCECKL